MKRLNLNLKLTGVIILLAVGVLLPVLLSTTVGIVALVVARDTGGIVMGVLVISFALAAAGSGLIAVLLTGRKARLARRQSDFVANVSHELRTPLSAIRLYAQTLQSGKVADDPAQTALCLDTIVRETAWLDATIDRVLTWRASSRDMLALQMAVQPVVPAVNDAIDRFRAMVVPDGLELTTAIDSRLCVAHDRVALNSVVLNLLTNAYKYTGPTKQIGVSVRDDGADVVIEVRDNGLGLSAADSKRVFQPFYRVADEEGRAVSGTGLGLAIARELVERHRGRITVRSEKGRGAIFEVRLPAETDVR